MLTGFVSFQDFIRLPKPLPGINAVSTSMVSVHTARIGHIWEISLTRLLVHRYTTPEQDTGGLGTREKDQEAR